MPGLVSLHHVILMIYLITSPAERGRKDDMVHKDWLVDVLRHLGYVEEAEAALKELPDHFSKEELEQFGNRHGINRDEVMNRMGGSP